MFNSLTNMVGRQVAKVTYFAAKNKAEILLGAGLVSMGVSLYEMHKAGMKVDKVLSDGKATIEKIENTKIDLAYADKYNEEDSKKDLRYAKLVIAKDLVKLYAPPVIMGGLGVYCILASHNVMKQRNAAIAAALSATTKAYDAFYKRVSDEYGEDVAKRLKYGYKEETVTETIMNEDGSSAVEVTKEKKMDETYGSPYAIFVPENHASYERDHEYMDIQARSWQNEAAWQVRKQGYLPLYSVIQMMHADDLLTPEQRKAAMVVGWTYDPDFNKTTSDDDKDNYILITCIPATRNNSEYDDKYQKGYILDFNVEGSIFDKVDKIK